MPKPELSLKEYLSRMHHPPEIQEKLSLIFGLPKAWECRTLNNPVANVFNRCADELESILGEPKL